MRFEVKSYIGANAAGAVVTYAWSVPHGNGEANVTTNYGGVATASIPLAQLLRGENVTVAGDVLSVSALCFLHRLIARAGAGASAR